MTEFEAISAFYTANERAINAALAAMPGVIAFIRTSPRTQVALLSIIGLFGLFACISNFIFPPAPAPEPESPPSEEASTIIGNMVYAELSNDSTYLHYDMTRIKADGVYLELKNNDGTIEEKKVPFNANDSKLINREFKTRFAGAIAAEERMLRQAAATGGRSKKV